MSNTAILKLELDGPKVRYIMTPHPMSVQKAFEEFGGCDVSIVYIGLKRDTTLEYQRLIREGMTSRDFTLLNRDFPKVDEGSQPALFELSPDFIGWKLADLAAAREGLEKLAIDVGPSPEVMELVRRAVSYDPTSPWYVLVKLNDEGRYDEARRVDVRYAKMPIPEVL